MEPPLRRPGAGAVAFRWKGVRPSAHPVRGSRERPGGRAFPYFGRAGRAGHRPARNRDLALGLGRYGRAGGTAPGRVGRSVAAIISRSFSGVRVFRAPLTQGPLSATVARTLEESLIRSGSTDSAVGNRAPTDQQ